MIYCLINKSSLNNNNMKINYSLINDSEELKINKTFKINFSEDNVIHFKFSKFQFKSNVLDDYIEEISNDFLRSKYILGKSDFENYFFKINEFEKMNDNFKFKYIKINEVLEKVNNLKDML